MTSRTMPPAILNAGKPIPRASSRSCPATIKTTRITVAIETHRMARVLLSLCGTCSVK
jgi:hypothetical protein